MIHCLDHNISIISILRQPKHLSYENDCYYKFPRLRQDAPLVQSNHCVHTTHGMRSIKRSQICLRRPEYLFLTLSNSGHVINKHPTFFNVIDVDTTLGIPRYSRDIVAGGKEVNNVIIWIVKKSVQRIDECVIGPQWAWRAGSAIFIITAGYSNPTNMRRWASVFLMVGQH